MIQADLSASEVIRRDSPVPYYYQLEEFLKRRIENGTWKPGQKIPSEAELCEAFEVGETFSGVDYETGWETVEELRWLVSPGATMAQFAFHWIVMFDRVNFAILGAKNARQTNDNAHASDLSALSGKVMTKMRGIYNRRVREEVHERW